jgi:glycosyltransferase involved in cell wall biosynthesis
MHILIIPSEHYVTHKIPLGAIFQHQQAHALKEKGINVGVISAGFLPFRMNFSNYPYLPYEYDNGVHTYRRYKRLFLPGRFAINSLFKYLVRLYMKTFEKYIHDQGLPDIIHAHNCLFAGLVALMIKERYGIPYIITEHSSLYERGLVTDQQNRITNEVLKNANKITVVSSSVGKLLVSLFGSNASPNYPINNILDYKFEKTENSLKNRMDSKSKFVFLSIGSLDDNKNHTDLINAFAYKFKDNSKVQLKIGGDGPLRKQLETQAINLGIENQVVFTGLLSRDSVLREMQHCDVFVLPSIVETFGVVLIEAMALGKPVVATKCGGPEDIVNQDNGVLVDKQDVNALAEALEYIYLEIDKYDESLIRRDCLSIFGKDTFVNRLQSIYETILETGKERFE